jgi:hypothetical protein
MREDTMSKIRFVLCLFFALWIALPSQSEAKQRELGNIGGVVRGSANAGLDKVKIWVYKDGEKIRELNSGARGEYTIRDLEPGNYTLSFGNASHSIERSLKVSAFRNSFCNISLAGENGMAIPVAPDPRNGRRSNSFARETMPTMPVSGAYVAPYIPQVQPLEYVAVESIRFISPARMPMQDISFSSNTAYFDLLLSMAEEGLLPNPAGIRFDEILNKFPLGISSAIGAEDLNINVAKLHNPLNANKELIGINLQAPRRQHPLPHVIMILDTSGRMGSRHKLELAVKSINKSLNIGAPFASISVIRAGQKPDLLLSAKLSEEGLRLPESIVADGSADLEAAFDLAHSLVDDPGSTKLLFFTDGVFGANSIAYITQSLSKMVKSGTHSYILGIGRKLYNDPNLYQLSRQSGAEYHYIGKEEDYLSFTHETEAFTGGISVQDLQIKLETGSSDMLKSYRLIGNRTVPESEASPELKLLSNTGMADTQPMNMHSNQELTLFLELDYGNAELSSSGMVKLMLSYKLPMEKQRRYREIAIDPQKMQTDESLNGKYQIALDAATLALLLAGDECSKNLNWQDFRLQHGKQGYTYMDLFEMHERFHYLITK